MAFEIVEGLGAAAAAVERLARGRAEFGEALGLGRAAARAGHGVGAEEGAARHGALGRCDAVFGELAPAFVAQPVGCRGRRRAAPPRSRARSCASPGSRNMWA